MAYVTIRIKGDEGFTQEDLAAERVVVGRSEECECTIKHESVSRQHCAFIRSDDSWSVEDLGSSNGTRVNADKLTGRRELQERDIVKIGKVRLTFHVGERKSRRDGASEGISLDQDAIGGKGLARSRQVGIDDPVEATECEHCGVWVSIAHRLAGDKMSCPSCDKTLVVPQLVT